MSSFLKKEKRKSPKKRETTQHITIKRKDGNQLGFKLIKIESLREYLLELWNQNGFSENITEKNNKEFGFKDDYKSVKVQNRIRKVIEELISGIFSKTDLSEYPVLWNDYMIIQKKLNGKNEIHFDKVSDEIRNSIIKIFYSGILGGTLFPKGVLEGIKYLTDGFSSEILVSKETYYNQIERCKKYGFSTQIDKNGNSSIVEIYKDGTLFEVDTCRPVYTMEMIFRNNPELKNSIESGEGMNNPILKGVFNFYKENGRTTEEFFEKCWSTKMGSFHMFFEKKNDNNEFLEYYNLEGIKPLCEYLGFDILNDDTNSLPISIPKETLNCNCGSGIPFTECHKEELFKYFPVIQTLWEESGREQIMILVSPN